MKKTTDRKLKLALDTVRALTNDDLLHVGGADDRTDRSIVACPKSRFICSNG